MKPEELTNLRTHTEQLSLALIREANPDGIIRTRHPDGSTGPDVPATHHLVEVMVELDSNVFADGISSALQWLLEPKNGVRDHPFTLDSLARLSKGSPEDEEALRKGIASRQLGDGSIPVFTGYLPGGDYFSTLWSVKVLAQYGDKVAFTAEIQRALDYLIDRRSVGPTSPSHIGFLAHLVSANRPSDKALLTELTNRMRNALDAPADALILTYRLFLIQDLMSVHRVMGGLEDEIDKHIIEIFDLSREARALPPALVAAQERFADSLFLETLARCAIVGIQRCNAAGQNLALSVNRLVHSDYRSTRYKALRTSASFRAFLERYGAIHESFSKYDDKLQEIWDRDPFEKTIFLMMPFRPDLKFKEFG